MQPDSDSAASDAAQPHVIVSLRLDFQMPDRGMARAVQEKLSQVVHHQLLTEAEPVFSEACAPGSTMRLDRLVVDLGVLRAEEMEADIMERFVPRLRQALTAAMPSSEKVAVPLRGLVPEGTFFIDNAGLVLLSPFLARYHEVNGLTNDGRFIDAAAAGRAVALLQVLLTDAQAVSDQAQALALNNVLCGLDPQTPVTGGFTPTAQEVTEARSLLQSAIQNWPVLQDLSVEGFRSSFLWRKGKLMRGEDRWTLTIEHHSYDVLFSSLPWSFSVIKPAWMPVPLYVDWV